MKLDFSALDGVQMNEGARTALISQITNQYAAEQIQHLKEFTRYKQDCRKRALDLAADQLRTPAFQAWLENNKMVKHDETTVMDKTPIIAHELLTSIAEKYYEWLILISNN